MNKRISARAVFPTTAAELAEAEQKRKRVEQDRTTRKLGDLTPTKSEKPPRARFSRQTKVRCQVEVSAPASQASTAKRSDGRRSRSAANELSNADAIDQSSVVPVTSIDWTLEDVTQADHVDFELEPENINFPTDEYRGDGVEDDEVVWRLPARSVAVGQHEDLWPPPARSSRGDDAVSVADPDANDIDALETLPDSPEPPLHGVPRGFDSMILGLADVHLMEGERGGVWASIRDSPPRDDLTVEDDRPPPVTIEDEELEHIAPGFSVDEGNSPPPLLQDEMDDVGDSPPQLLQYEMYGVGDSPPPFLLDAMGDAIDMNISKAGDDEHLEYAETNLDELDPEPESTQS